MRKYVKYVMMGVIAVALSAIIFKPHTPSNTPNAIRNFEEIVNSGILRAITEYNSISYHAQGDTIGGLHYELLQAFAQSQGLQAEITPEMSVENRIKGIKEGSGSII